jgi:murein DD-endopeptidase MepM/ murein hydrolase activator NlpD
MRTACVQLAAVRLHVPGRKPRVLAQRAARGPFVYPANRSVVSFGSLSVLRRCSQRRGEIVVHALSLFRGVVTAATVAVRVRGASSRIRIAAMRVDGKTVASGNRPIALGSWASMTVGRTRHAARASALVVHLRRPRAGLPRGTTLTVAFAVVRLPKAVKQSGARRRARSHLPLKVTPPLGLRHYVFPIAGKVTFGDSYGAFRADVPGNWHHGDDIFAAVGTPVVAVANGTLNRVGWEKLGGWRLWVRDRRGNEFYYAHLSGYAPQALHSKRVRPGEVLGFVGNTGDAFTTPFHLHFEVHPRQLLYLHYDGAVDPTSYLDRWQHIPAVQAPTPVMPAQLPQGDPRREARFVFRELLAARGLTHRAPSPPPKLRLPGIDAAVRPFTGALPDTPLSHTGRSIAGRTLFIAPFSVVALALCGGAALFFVRRRRSAE